MIVKNKSQHAVSLLGLLLFLILAVGSVDDSGSSGNSSRSNHKSPSTTIPQASEHKTYHRKSSAHLPEYVVLDRDTYDAPVKTQIVLHAVVSGSITVSRST